VRTWVNARLLVIAAAGVSAGIHAGLAPEHFDRSRPIGISFGLAAAALTLTAAALAVRPDAAWPALVSAALFASLLGAYVLFRDDPFDVLAAITKIVEAAGLGLSLWLLRTKPGTRPGDLAIVRAIIALAEAFGLEVVAEGVETETAALTLLRHGCYRAQGFLLSRPVVGDAMEALLAAGRVPVDFSTAPRL